MTVLLLRTIIMFSFVVLAIRIMGKRTIGELQASELVITLLISDIAAVPMQETGTPLLAGIIPIAVLVALEVLISYIVIKKPTFGRLINGSPVVVIKAGKILQNELQRLRMTSEDLFEGLRKNGCFDIFSVEYAVVETDGTLSVLQRQQNGQQPRLTALLVSDGSIDEHSMKLVGWDKDRVVSTALKENADLHDIFILAADQSGSYRLIRRRDDTK